MSAWQQGGMVNPQRMGRKKKRKKRAEERIELELSAGKEGREHLFGLELAALVGKVDEDFGPFDFGVTELQPHGMVEHMRESGVVIRKHANTPFANHELGRAVCPPQPTHAHRPSPHTHKNKYTLTHARLKRTNKRKDHGPGRSSGP